MTEFQFTTEELNSEIWKPIPDYERYDISSLGRVRRRDACKGRPAGYILSQRLSGLGYLMVCLQSPVTGEKSLCVHKLVGLTFLTKARSDQTQVNHIDGIKTNNRLCNLEWVSPKENTRHSIEVLGNDHSGERHAMAKLTPQQVLEIHDLRMQGYAANYIAGMFGVSKRAVLQIIHRRSWKKLLAELPTNYPKEVHYGKRGSNSWKATISNETAIAIKQALADGESDHDLVARYSVPLTTIRNIKYGKSWKHVII